jgi:hypothetical protein
MQAWSTKARRLVPELQVVGALRDAPGWLVIVDIAPTAPALEGIEASLKRLGATGWHWETHRGKIKMRVYTAKRHRGPLYALLAAALTSIILCWHHDIHNLASLTKLWSY